MEKVLFAADELTGLIWSYALMRESRNCDGMEVSGLKKKFKDKRFAAGCSRDVIKTGAERLGWEITDLFDKTIRAMQNCEKMQKKSAADLISPGTSVGKTGVLFHFRTALLYIL